MLKHLKLYLIKEMPYYFISNDKNLCLDLILSLPHKYVKDIKKKNIEIKGNINEKSSKNS